MSTRNWWNGGGARQIVKFHFIWVCHIVHFQCICAMSHLWTPGLIKYGGTSPIVHFKRIWVCLRNKFRCIFDVYEDHMPRYDANRSKISDLRMCVCWCRGPVFPVHRAPSFLPPTRGFLLTHHSVSLPCDHFRAILFGPVKVYILTFSIIPHMRHIFDSSM